jgi:hypothetical protein
MPDLLFEIRISRANLGGVSPLVYGLLVASELILLDCGIPARGVLSSAVQKARMALNGQNSGHSLLLNTETQIANALLTS